MERFAIKNLEKEYTSIGGQAVIEGVMMRSPNAFVVAVRKTDGTIRLRQDQWYGLSKKFKYFRKPFIRGILILIEAMANGIVSLNYSANIAMNEELKEKALKKGKTQEEFEAELKKKEKVDLTTFITIFLSVLFGLGLFVFVPHALTVWLENGLGVKWGLDSFIFHAIDGLIKALIFVLYIYLIGFLPDIKRVFQYHGAEHKSIATFEAGLELTVENAKKYSTLHPRCGTSFIFFLLFISIILFSMVFVFIPVKAVFPIDLLAAPGTLIFNTKFLGINFSGIELNSFLTHFFAIIVKIFLMIPIAGISYEIIKFAGKHQSNVFCRILSSPGMLLQRLTTNEPDDQQLEVGLLSIRAVLALEKKYDLKNVSEKVVRLQEFDIKNIEEIEKTDIELKDFLE